MSLKEAEELFKAVKNAVEDNGKAQLASLQFLEGQMLKLQNEIAVYQTARAAYAAKLKSELGRTEDR